MRIFFAAGGTAGHINPAIAVAQYIQTKPDTNEFLFAAVPGGMEERLVSEAGFKTVPIKIYGLKRAFSLENIKRIWMIPGAVHAAKKILQSFAPQLVFATGGYLSYPVICAAKKLNIPCVIHESNATPGLSVKLLAKKAELVLTGFADTKQALHKKCITEQVGIPLRSDFESMTRPVARRMLGVPDGCVSILSYGGSLGAEKMNQMLLPCMKEMLTKYPNFRWTHACGKNKYEMCMAHAKNLGIASSPHITLLPYIDQMALQMASADIVISRAGAITLAELSRLGKAAILIPFPGATGDHQTKNAEALFAAGSCIFIPEKDLTSELLFQKIQNMIDHPARRKTMERNIRTFFPTNPERTICQHLKNITKQ